MVEVPSTALDMGNEEHHYGNWRAQNTSMRCLQGLQGECLVTVLHNSLWLCIVLSVCLMAWNPVVSFARNVMDNLILLGINCDADYTRRYTGHGWCVVCVGVTWCQGLSLCREGAPQFVPNFVTGADCGLTLIIWISEETCWRVVKWSKLLSLLQSVHACNAPSWQYVRNDEAEKLSLAGVPGLTEDNVSCIMWHQTSGRSEDTNTA